MKPFFLGFFLLIMTISKSQSINLFADSVLIDVKPIYKKDSLSFEITIKNLKKNTIYLPIPFSDHKQNDIPKVGFYITNSKEIKINIGQTSSGFGGISLETAVFTMHFNSNDEIVFKTYFLRRPKKVDKVSLLLDYMDQISLDRMDSQGSKKYISGQDYYNNAKIFRFEVHL